MFAQHYEFKGLQPGLQESSLTAESIRPDVIKLS